MTHPFPSQLRFMLRTALTAMFVGGAVAGATNFDLSLTKTADVTTLNAGGTINFTLKVSNAGPYAATNVVIDDMLPKGFKFVSATPAASRVDTTSDPKIAQYFFNLGTINAGSSKTITLQATGVAPSAITSPSIDAHYNYKNIAEVYSVDNSTYDPDSRPNNCDYSTIAAGKSLEDDCAYVRVPVNEVSYPQLSIAKTANGPWTAGQTGAAYTLNVANLGTVATNGTITVTDQLPDGLTLGTPSLPAGWSYTTSGQLVTLTSSGILSAGSNVNLTLPVSISTSAASSITNKAVVSGGGDPDPAPVLATCTPSSTNPSNQCASVTTTVTIPTPPITTCTSLYSLLITSTAKDAYGNVLLYNGGKIQRLDELSNTLSGTAINLPSGATSATLAIAPDGSKFFTADDNNYLRIYNATTGTWSTGGYFSGVSDRLVRMGMTPSGTGYAMDSSGYLWSFTQSGSTTSLGRLSATSSTAPNFYANGDFFSTGDGKLYMLSAQTGGKVNLWYVNPVAKTAEYLGDLTNAGSGVQYNGLAATPNGIFAGNTAGTLYKVDPVNVSITQVGGTTTGSTDLASCYYPKYAPNVSATKSVAKVAGSAGSDVRAGDTLEYTITVRNSGNLPAGGALFRDALPAGTTYVAGSAKVNGFGSTNTAGSPTSLTGSAYPFSATTGVGICSMSSAACTNQVLKVDTTPTTLDNEAVITFRVTVNDGVSSVKNKAVITYNDGNTPPTDIPTNETNTPVVNYPQLTLAKTSNAVNSTWALGGSNYTYTLTVTNSGSVATGGTITVKDQLPTGITPTSSSFSPATGWNCTTSGQVITCTSTGVLAVGASSALTIPVNLSADAVGSSTNKASVGGGGDPDAIPDPATCTPSSTNPNNQCASVTVTVTNSNTPAVCTNLYGLMMTPGGSVYPAYGRSIQLISDSNNTLGATVATLPNNQTSAALGISPDGKKFFVAADTSGNTSPLLVYDTVAAQWVTGGTFTMGSSADRMVRMTVASNGTGYAMDSAGKLYSFATAAPYSVTSLGQVTTNSSGAPGFAANGDMFATDKGLYMLSSVDGTASIDLWLINPATRNAEYLGRESDPGQANAQYNGFAATPNGVFGRDNYGRLVKIDLNNLTLQPVGTPTNGSTDLASCYYPTFAPNLNVIKTAKKVAGSTGTDVLPGDTLEYTVTVRNSGNVPAGGVTFQDALPAGTSYVADSAKVNGFSTTVTGGTATNLAGAAYPFANPVGICSTGSAACTNQVLKIDTTPNTTDNEAVITFRVKVNDPFTLSPSQVANQAVVKYTDGPSGGVPSDDPSTPTPNDPTITPVTKPVKLVVEKTVQNITAGTPVGTAVSGKPGDVLEYCIKTSNLGSAYAANITFGDNVPANTVFLLGGFGAGQDIHVTTSTGVDLYYTAAQDTDAGALVNNRVTVNGGSFILQPQQNFTVCFRATIQ